MEGNALLMTVCGAGHIGVSCMPLCMCVCVHLCGVHTQPSYWPILQGGKPQPHPLAWDRKSPQGTPVAGKQESWGALVWWRQQLSDII